MGGPRSSLWTLTLKLKPALIAMVLQVFDTVPALLCAQYITLTFFASRHGGGDCQATPSSEACRQASSDVALYSGISNGFCNAAGALFAMGLGSYSDVKGRRHPILIRAVIGVFVPASLALHAFTNMTLWCYLVVCPIFRSFDVSGVYLAFISDVLEPHERSIATGLMLTWVIAAVLVALPLSGLLPQQCLLILSMVASVLKLIFVYVNFPDTRSTKAQESGVQRAMYAPMTLISIISRHSFIFRTALVLVMGSFSSAGMNTILSPYLTGYLGFTRETSMYTLAACLVSGVLSLGFGVGHLVRRVGQIGALQTCLAATVLFPLLCTCCAEPWHFIILSAVCVGPMIAQVPIISGIKSNLVARDEQGLVQGALIAVCNFATAMSDALFGWLYVVWTQGGTEPSRSAVSPLFFLVACLAAASWSLALSLPHTMPPPPDGHCHSHTQSLL